MKYFIVIVCFVAVALAQRDPECSRENRPKVRPSDCCKGSALIAKNDLARCEKLYPSSNSTEKGDRFRSGGCVVECFLNQTGILKNGKIDAAVALTQFMKSADSSLRSVIKSAIDTCVTEDGKGGPNGRRGGKDGKFEGKGKPVNGTEGPRGGKREGSGPRCGHKAHHFTRCVEMKVYEGCPAAQKVTSPDCTQLSTFITKCKPEKKD